MNSGVYTVECVQAVQDYCYPLAMLLPQNVVHQRGFARTEIALTTYVRHLAHFYYRHTAYQ